jgi:hypothetical protein
VCLAARVSGGLKSRSARDHGPLSQGGGTASPAGERGRDGEPYPGTKAKAGHSQGGPEALLSQDSGGQGAHREGGSEGLAENHRVVIAGRHPQEEPVGQRWGMVEPALWRRRRRVLPQRTTVCADDTVGKRRGCPRETWYRPNGRYGRNRVTPADERAGNGEHKPRPEATER